MRSLILGTRRSALARTQTAWVAQGLQQLGHRVAIKHIVTQGDAKPNVNFDKLLDKGFFTKELEEALLRGDIDIAVHSLKDLPTESPEGLCIAAVSQRAAAGDCLIAKTPLPLARGARVATSAVRRLAQLRWWRPDLQLGPLRGNVPTRLQRLRDGEIDAVVLAQAGLDRLHLELDMTGLQRWNVPCDVMVPAPGQGSLALQTRAEATQLRACLQPLHDATAATCIALERQILAAVHGGCHAPLGAYATQGGRHVRVFWQATPQVPVQAFALEAADPESALAAVLQRLAVV